MEKLYTLLDVAKMLLSIPLFEDVGIETAELKLKYRSSYGLKCEYTCGIGRGRVEEEKKKEKKK